MLRTERKVHRGLRGGKGKVVTNTTWLKRWIFFGKPDSLQAITLDFDPFASVGKHMHTTDIEIYITFNRFIRFNKWKFWSPINICLKGHEHCAQNLSNENARVYALKI